MSKLELEIIVKGYVGTGKSTIAHLIEQALKKNFAGTTEIVDEEIIDLDGWKSNQKKRLKTLKDSGLKIKIRTQQVNRKSRTKIYPAWSEEW